MIIKKYLIKLVLASLIFSGNADHLIFNRIAVKPDQGELIEIYNPTNETVDLSNYYLSDQNDYYNWIFDNTSTINSRDFLIKFPNGSQIQSEESFIISTTSSEDFLNYYNQAPNISLIDTEFEIFEIGSNAGLDNNQEMLVLFYWDGNSEIIQDVDYFLWGSTLRGFSKTTDDGYPYNDTILDDQTFIRNYGTSDFYDSLYIRLDINEYDEIQFDGNGITGHDETSENFIVSWSVEGIEKVISFQDIIDGEYDCAGNSQDGCPLGNLDCPIVNPSGMIVDYFDITQFGGPHAITIEDSDGYRLELTIWPDNWDIANDPEYSKLLEAPFNRFLVQGFGNVFEYNGEKQILVCNVDDFTILQSFDMEGQFDGFEDIDDDGILTQEEPYIDSNGNGQWDEAYCENDIYQDQESCENIDLNWNAGFCINIDYQDQESCEYVDLIWNPEESFEDLNENGQWDAVYEELYSFDKAIISPVPYVLIASAYEVLDFSYSFPSNSRVIIRVFDISGRFITTLVDKYYESSGIVTRQESSSAWDGTNQMGQVQPPGTYLMHMEASNFQTGKTSIDIAPVVIGVKK